MGKIVYLYGRVTWQRQLVVRKKVVPKRLTSSYHAFLRDCCTHVLKA